MRSSMVLRREKASSSVALLPPSMRRTVQTVPSTKSVMLSSSAWSEGGIANIAAIKSKTMISNRDVIVVECLIPDSPFE